MAAHDLRWEMEALESPELFKHFSWLSSAPDVRFFMVVSAKLSRPPGLIGGSFAACSLLTSVDFS